MTVIGVKIVWRASSWGGIMELATQTSLTPMQAMQPETRAATDLAVTSGTGGNRGVVDAMHRTEWPMKCRGGE